MSSSLKPYSVMLMFIVVLSCAVESWCQICGKTAYGDAPSVELYATITDHTSHSAKPRRFYSDILVQTDSNITITCTAKEPIQRYPASYYHDYGSYLQPYVIDWFVNSSFFHVSNCDETPRKVKSCSFSLVKIRPRDHGKYFCQAASEAGCTFKELDLKVAGGKKPDSTSTTPKNLQSLPSEGKPSETGRTRAGHKNIVKKIKLPSI